MYQIQENYALKAYNTFGIEVFADYFIEVSDVEDLPKLFQQDLREYGPLLILGGGSNMLFTKNYKGLVLKMNNTSIELKSETENEVFIEAGAGLVWNSLVQYAVKQNYGGIENLSLIPGSVGAAPVQNIGAYGVELKDVFFACRAFDTLNKEFVDFKLLDCQFAYRDSIFKSTYKGRYIITSVMLRLNKHPQINISYGAISAELKLRHITQPNIQQVSEVVSHIRVSKLPDPATIGNAGSFFKNPILEAEEFNSLIKQFPELVFYPFGQQYKLAAGYLIESCGWKGHVEGQTGTWKNQALVLVNHAAASGQEVYDFSEKIIQSVAEKYGVNLEREVNVL